MERLELEDYCSWSDDNRWSKEARVARETTPKAHGACGLATVTVAVSERPTLTLHFLPELIRSAIRTARRISESGAGCDGDGGLEWAVGFMASKDRCRLSGAESVRSSTPPAGNRESLPTTVANGGRSVTVSRVVVDISFPKISSVNGNPSVRYALAYNRDCPGKKKRRRACLSPGPSACHLTLERKWGSASIRRRLAADNGTLGVGALLLPACCSRYFSYSLWCPLLGLIHRLGHFFS